MNDVNWWLMVLSFVLGLILTLAFMIRRVTREVPIYAALGRGPQVEVDQPAAKAVAKPAAKPVAKPAAATVAGDTAAAELVKSEPYGKGSARVGADGIGPAGWTIKGNEDSMLYHTPASPSYEQTIAELWFVDEAAAEAAGFKKYK